MIPRFSSRLARHGRAALRTLHLGARHAARVRNGRSALGADARANRSGGRRTPHASAPRAAGAHAAAPAACAAASAQTGALSERSCSIASWHDITSPYLVRDFDGAGSGADAAATAHAPAAISPAPPLCLTASGGGRGIEGGERPCKGPHCRLSLALASQRVRLSAFLGLAALEFFKPPLDGVQLGLHGAHLLLQRLAFDFRRGRPEGVR